jgi:hypothetical protein
MFASVIRLRSVEVLVMSINWLLFNANSNSLAAETLYGKLFSAKEATLKHFHAFPLSVLWFY